MKTEDYLNDLRTVLVAADECEADIVAAEQYAENLMQLGMPVIFDLHHFAKLVGKEARDIGNMMVHQEDFFYRQVQIEKKHGGYRTLDIPAVNLRKIQKWILKNILYQISVSEHACGFCKKRSIVTNAERHVGKGCVINVDIKDFFPSVHGDQIFKIFYYYGYTTEVSYLLSRLCTYRDYLPQGAPTSPYLSNIVCLKLDKRLSQLAKSYHAEYSRYADDITFSGNAGIKAMLPIVERILNEEGYLLNKDKTRIAYKHQRQEVTGLLVNGTTVQVSKQYLKKFSQEIYYCKKFGVRSHMEHIHCEKRFFRDHMYGKAYFIQMVDRDMGKRYFAELEQIDWES